MGKPRKRRSKGEGGVVELKDGRFQGRYTHEGKRLVVYGKTREECEDKLREMIVNIKAGKHQPMISGIPAVVEVAPESPMVSEWLASWLKACQPKLSPRSWDLYAQHARDHIEPYFLRHTLAMVDPAVIDAWYADLAQAKVSAALRKKVATTFSIALRYAVKLGKIASNPVSIAGKPRAKSKEIRPLTREEIKRFMEAARADPFYAMYRLALDSGMRQGEMIAAHWDALDFTAGTLRVLYTMERKGSKLRRKEVKTGSSRRTLRLSTGTMDTLRELRRNATGEVMFADGKGGYLRAPNLTRRSFKPICARAGLADVRFHDLRHTCASHLLNEGVNVKAVSVRLGHADVMTTLRTYAHVLPGAEEKILEVVEDLLR